MFDRIALITLMAAAAVATPAAPAHAELTWGEFKDNGCINPISHPGLRSKSAVLWGIPAGQSWEQTCAATPATIDGVRFAHPAVCVNTAAVEPLVAGAGGILGGILCGAAGVGISLLSGEAQSGFIEACANVIVLSADMMVQTVASGYYERPAQAIAGQGRVKRWPFKLFGAVTPGERSGWKGKLAAAVGQNGVGQVKQGTGGLNIWGVFAVPDERCLPPNYMGLRDAPHNHAARACQEAGLRLCRQDELCQGGQPVMGKPDGDIWAAVSGGPNAWISIGTSYPDRLCRTHEDVTGHPPTWGTDRGPQPITGKPTTFRCCR